MGGEFEFLAKEDLCCEYVWMVKVVEKIYRIEKIIPFPILPNEIIQLTLS